MNEKREALHLTDEQAMARYGKIAEMIQSSGQLHATNLKYYLDEICWNPQAIRDAINKVCDSAQFPSLRAAYSAYLTSATSLSLVARTINVGSYPPAELEFVFKLEEREGKYKIGEYVTTHSRQSLWPQGDFGHAGRFSHPRLGLREVDYDPGQVYGPGPQGYRGFRTSVFKPGMGFVKQSQIDLLVTSFEEIKPYFEILEKRHFDTQHEMAIFETIMQRSCGPDLKPYWRFNMIGRWDEGQDAGARLILETYEKGHEGEDTMISSYRTAFGTYLDGIPPRHSSMQPQYTTI